MKTTTARFVSMLRSDVVCTSNEEPVDNCDYLDKMNLDANVEEWLKPSESHD
jgi:hypothetical protein